jgi:hypothetical protein
MKRPLSPPTRADGPHRRWRGRNVYAVLLGTIAALGLTGLSAAPALAAPTPGGATGSFTVPAGTVDPSDVNVELITPNGNQVVTATDTTTGATTGTYAFTDPIAPGQYYVYFSDNTAGDNVQSDYYGDGGTDNIQKATLITIPAGGIATLGAATLGGGATITGTLTDANSATDSNATVYIDPVYTGATLDPGLEKFESVTGTGSYTLSGLPAGTYQVEYMASGTNAAGTSYYFDVYVNSSGLTYDAQSGTEYAVAAGSTTTANISVPALGQVTGTVSGPSGALSGDNITAYDGLGSTVSGGQATTAGDGTYSIVLLPGTYKIDFGGLAPQNLAPTWFGGATESQATAVTVGAGGTTANINATLGAGATISGTVTAGQGGAVLGGMDVELLDAQGNDIEEVFSQPDGTYTLTNIPAGTWYVEFNGGIADNGQYYASEFYGGTRSQFGATAITTTAGQAVTSVNGVLLPAGVTALGLPKTSSPALSGLHNNKVALRFNVAAGAGAGYLKTLTVGLPKHFSWNRKTLARDLSLGAGVTYTEAITSGRLVVTLTNGEPAVKFSLKAGGITVTKAIEKAAGGTTTKKKTKKKKHDLAMAAKAKKKPAKPKDTIKAETINLAVADTTGVITSLPIVVKKPH